MWVFHDNHCLMLFFYIKGPDMEQNIKNLHFISNIYGAKMYFVSNVRETSITFFLKTLYRFFFIF